jgi:hypothetical protein
MVTKKNPPPKRAAGPSATPKPTSGAAGNKMTQMRKTGGKKGC